MNASNAQSLGSSEYGDVTVLFPGKPKSCDFTRRKVHNWRLWPLFTFNHGYQRRKDQDRFWVSESSTSRSVYGGCTSLLQTPATLLPCFASSLTTSLLCESLSPGEINDVFNGNVGLSSSEGGTYSLSPIALITKNTALNITRFSPLTRYRCSRFGR